MSKTISDIAFEAAEQTLGIASCAARERIILSAIREAMKLCEPYMSHLKCKHWSHVTLPKQYPEDGCDCGLDQLKEQMK